MEILTAAEIKSASSELRRIIGYFTETDQLIDAATDISIAHNHKIYDCLYLALALQTKNPLATADRRIASLAIRIGIATELVEAEA